MSDHFYLGSSKRSPTMRYILAKVSETGELHYLRGTQFGAIFLPGDPRDEQWLTSYDIDVIEDAADLLIRECEDFCIIAVVASWEK